MKMKALTLVLIGALGLSWMAQAELVTTQSKPSIQASLKALHGSNLDVSVFDQLMITHLQAVAAGKVHGNQSILDISLYSLEDSSAKSRFVALGQPNLLNATTATAEQLKLPTLKLVKKTVAGITIDSVDADTFNTLAKIVSQTQDVPNWAGLDAEKHQQRVENILQKVWLKSVEEWDNNIADDGWLTPSFYPDLIALVNHANTHNQAPSIETFRQLLDASIVLARGQNYPDTAFGKKLYQKSFPKITQALATYLALTSSTEEVKASQLALVHVKIGELGSIFPSYRGDLYVSMKSKAKQAPSFGMAEMLSGHQRFLDDYALFHSKDKIYARSLELDGKIAKADEKIAKAEKELAQSEKELAFIREANQAQKDFLAALDTKDDTKISKLKSVYTKLQDLNSRADLESSDPRIKNTLLKLTKLCEERISDK